MILPAGSEGSPPDRSSLPHRDRKPSSGLGLHGLRSPRSSAELGDPLSGPGTRPGPGTDSQPATGPGSRSETGSGPIRLPCPVQLRTASKTREPRTPSALAYDFLQPPITPRIHWIHASIAPFGVRQLRADVKALKPESRAPDMGSKPPAWLGTGGHYPSRPSPNLSCTHESNPSSVAALCERRKQLWQRLHPEVLGSPYGSILSSVIDRRYRRFSADRWH